MCRGECRCALALYDGDFSCRPRHQCGRWALNLWRAYALPENCDECRAPNLASRARAGKHEFAAFEWPLSTVRPSATTFVGLLPLMFAQSTQAQFLTPMAVSMGFGVIVSTLVTLLLVPLNYSLLEQAGETLRRWLGERPTPVAESTS